MACSQLLPFAKNAYLHRKALGLSRRGKVFAHADGANGAEACKARFGQLHFIRRDNKDSDETIVGQSLDGLDQRVAAFVSGSGRERGLPIKVLCT